MTEREAFEAGFAKIAPSSAWLGRCKWDEDQYESSYVQLAWKCWQASRKQALTEAADMVHKGGNFRMALAIRSLTTTPGEAA